MPTKWGDTFIILGRLVISVLVAVTIANGLGENVRFYDDQLTPILAGIFGGVVLFIMLQIISQKS